ncbi:MAG: hypothetical protein M3Q34_00965 [bacterium]|nr:hypothetical protein [bacterium]
MYQGKAVRVIDQRPSDGGITVHDLLGKYIGYYDSRAWGGTGEGVDTIDKKALYCIGRKM